MPHWWVSQAWEQSPVHLVSWVVWVIGSIVLHELAHGWAAIRLGDRTPIETGHMTWNPLVHMGRASLMMFAIFGIAWGQMPVDPSRLRGRYGEATVALAGPMMNLLLFAVALGAAAAVIVAGKGLGSPMRENLLEFCITGAWLNLALMLFNLLPVPPLDGSRILAQTIPAYGRLWSGEQGQGAAMVAFALLFIFGGRFVFGTSSDLTVQALRLVLGALGKPGP